MSIELHSGAIIEFNMILHWRSAITLFMVSTCFLAFAYAQSVSSSQQAPAAQIAPEAAEIQVLVWPSNKHIRLPVVGQKQFKCAQRT